MQQAATARRTPVAVQCTSVDDASRFGTAVYHPHRLEVLDESQPFGMRLTAATFGPVTVGLLSYSAPVRIETDDMETAYEINVPLSSEVECWAGTDRVVASPERAVVFQPHGPTSMNGFGNHDALLGVKLDRSALEDQLAQLVGRAERCPLDPAPDIYLTSGRGRAWWSIARAVIDLFGSSNDGFGPPDDGGGLINNELIMRPLTQSLLTGLLFAVDHPLLPQLLGPAEPAVPASVRRAEDFINDHAAEALSITDIARATRMSVRGLQASFQQHLQQTPMDYLRKVRLQRAHSDLVAGDPENITVAQVAYRWGFAHAGRFASRYRASFGVSPSESLKD